PDGAEALQVGVEQQGDRLHMTDRRDAADGVAGRCAHEVGVGAGQRLADAGGHLGFADPVLATGDDDDCHAAVLAPEHDPLGDLRDRAADRGGGLRAGARRLLELDDPGVDAGVAEQLRGAQGGGMLGGFHGNFAWAGAAMVARRAASLVASRPGGGCTRQLAGRRWFRPRTGGGRMSAVPAPQSGAVPGRARGFLSGAREIADAVVDVQGALPPWLAGTLLLNGPALWELPGGRLDHWFDGYAMWHALRIDGAGVRYRSRFCASESYRRSVTAGAPVYGEFGTANPAGLLARLKGTKVT